jgi:hypothetical protein
MPTIKSETVCITQATRLPATVRAPDILAQLRRSASLSQVQKSLTDAHNRGLIQRIHVGDHYEYHG